VLGEERSLERCANYHGGDFVGDAGGERGDAARPVGTRWTGWRTRARLTIARTRTRVAAWSAAGDAEPDGGDTAHFDQGGAIWSVAAAGDGGLFYGFEGVGGEQVVNGGGQAGERLGRGGVVPLRVEEKVAERTVKIAVSWSSTSRAA
jgi:hypothetical protein